MFFKVKKKSTSQFDGLLKIAALAMFVIIVVKEDIPILEMFNPTVKSNQKESVVHDKKYTEIKPEKIDLNPDYWINNKGTKVYFIESHELPIVDVNLIFNAGAARDDKLAGLAYLTNSLLLSGTKNLTIDDLHLKLELLGVELDIDSHRDMAVINMRILSDSQYLNPAIKLLQEMISQPSFPQSEIDRLKNQLLISLNYEQQKPNKQLSKHFYQSLYQDHPYSNHRIGNQESIKKIKRDDITQFHKQYYVGKNLVIAIVGDIDKTQAEKLADQLTSQLIPGHPAEKLPSAPAIKNSTKHIEFNSQQTHILLGGLGIQRGNADHYALQIANHILGGGSTSLLYETIRAEHGLAYSIYSHHIPMQSRGPILINMQTQHTQAQQALEKLNQVLADYLTNGATEQQIKDAKRYLIGSFPSHFATNKNKASYLGMIGFYDLPLDYLKNYTENIESVTLEQINTVIKKYFDLEKMVTLTIGNSEQ